MDGCVYPVPSLLVWPSGRVTISACLMNMDIIKCAFHQKLCLQLQCLLYGQPKHKRVFGTAFEQKILCLASNHILLVILFLTSYNNRIVKLNFPCALLF